MPHDLRLAIRRYPVPFAVLILVIIAIVGVGLVDRPERAPFAVTKVVILPDPRAPISTATPVLPAYQTFGTKLSSLESGPVLRRAAELALGIRPFESPEFRAPHLRPRLEAGIGSVRERFGDASDPLETLVRELVLRVGCRHIARQQIVEIRVRGEGTTDAVFLSWAVAEAAHQLHGERMRREAEIVRRRLGDEIEAASVSLSRLEESEDSEHLPHEVLHRMRGTILFTAAERLAREESRLEIARRRNALGRLPLGTELGSPRPGFLRERNRIAQVLREKRLESGIRSTVLTDLHPEMRARRGEIETLSARLSQMDAARVLLVEQQRGAYLEWERAELDREADLLADHRAWLAGRAQDWLAASIPTWREPEAERLRAHLQSIRALDRQVARFSRALGTPVVILSPAMDATLHRVSAPRGSGVLLLLLLAAVTGIVGLTVLERWRDVLRGRRDVEERLGLPLLGVVPASRPGAIDPVSEETGGGAGTNLSALVSTLCDSVRGPHPRVLAVAGAEVGEGRTRFSVRLAAALARRGRRVLLVDGDLRDPGIARTFGILEGPGLSPCLIEADSELPVEETIVAGPLPTLDLLPSVPLTPDVLAIFSASRLGRCLGTLAELYDHVVIDTPALARAGDALAIAQAADGVILFAEAYRTPRRRVESAKDQLEASGARVVGAVLGRYPARPAGVFSRGAERNESRVAEPSERRSVTI